MKSANFTLWIKRALESIYSLEREFLRVLGVFFYAIMEEALISVRLFFRRFACKSF